MNVNFNGYGEGIATFIADESLTGAGVPVKISDSGTVAACESGDVFCGICVSVRDGYAAVQLAGYAAVKTESKLSTGYVKLAAGSDGTVAEASGGRELLVVSSDDSEAGIIL